MIDAPHHLPAAATHDGEEEDYEQKKRGEQRRLRRGAAEMLGVGEK